MQRKTDTSVTKHVDALQTDAQDLESSSDGEETDIRNIQLGDGTYQVLESFTKNMKNLVTMLKQKKTKIQLKKKFHQ